MITLYVDGFFVSPLDASCMIALAEKGVEYQTARALLRDGQGVPASLGAKTMIGRVPAIQHGDFYLSESIAIIEYLEDAFPPPAHPRLFPAEPRARARARQAMSYVRCDLIALRDERQWWSCVYPAVELPPLSPRARRDAIELIEFARRVIVELGEFSIAQADLAIQLMRLTHHNDIAIPDEIRRFVDTVTARPSLREYIGHQRPPNPPARNVAAG